MATWPGHVVYGCFILCLFIVAFFHYLNKHSHASKIKINECTVRVSLATPVSQREHQVQVQEKEPGQNKNQKRTTTSSTVQPFGQSAPRRVDAVFFTQASPFDSWAVGGRISDLLPPLGFCLGRRGTLLGCIQLGRGKTPN